MLQIALMPPSVLESLLQVREIRSRLAIQQFKGYSGITRAFGGLCAALGAFLMNADFFPKTIAAHFYGWGFVCAIAGLLNFSALMMWWTRNKGEQPRLSELKPIIEPIIIVLISGALTFALMKAQAPQLLFGVWMCLFGLINLSARHLLPNQVFGIGLFYIISGLICLWMADSPNFFLNPKPMGFVFFFGELMGGWYFHWHLKQDQLESR